MPGRVADAGDPAFSDVTRRPSRAPCTNATLGERGGCDAPLHRAVRPPDEGDNGSLTTSAASAERRVQALTLQRERERTGSSVCPDGNTSPGRSSTQTPRPDWIELRANAQVP